MSAHQFLNLLRMVETGRKCEGKPCMELSDEIMARSNEIEGSRTSHKAEEVHREDVATDCPECEAIRQQEIALRESLHAQGIDFPVGMLNGQPEP